LAWGVPGQGVTVKGVKGDKYGLKQHGMYENGKKTGSFPHQLTSKSAKTPFFIY
jgi:hypothetical protein